MEKAIAIILFLEFIRSFEGLKLIKVFGVLIKIVFNCFQDVFFFLVLWAIIILAFSISFFLLFEDESDEYKGFYVTIVNLN